jgi:glycerol uptake facilitator-like aquaporin
VGAYWFTASTSFANPAVTIGRTLSDTFAGIAPSSVPGFVVAQVVGAALATLVALVMWPAPSTADAVALDVHTERR